MAILLASGCTSKVYSPRSWYACELFSVRIGRTIVLCIVGIAQSPFFFFFAADFFAAVFFVAAFFAAGFPAFFAADFGAAFVAAFLAAFLAAFFAAFAS